MFSLSHPLTSDYKNGKITKTYKLKINFNKKLSLIYLENKIPKSVMDNVMSDIELSEAEEHLDKLIKKVTNKLNLDKKYLIRGFSYKDKSLIDRFKKIGFRNSKLLLSLENKTIHNYLDVFHKMNFSETYDFLIFRHSIEHSYNIQKTFSKISQLTNDNSYILFEIPDVKKQLENGDCTFIWDEHNFYFTEKSFKNILNINGYEIILTNKYKYLYEDCLIFLVKKKIRKNYKILKEYNLINKFIDIHNERKIKINKIFRYYEKKNYTFILYGAGHLSVTFIHLMKITKKIKLAIDGDKMKIGKYLPGTDINISDFNKNIKIDKVVLLLGMNPLRIKQSIKKLKNGEKFVLFSIFRGNRYSIDKKITFNE